MKKIMSFFCALLLISASGIAQKIRFDEPVRFLALGDSYTFGQSVPESERWCQQLYDTLESFGYELGELEVIARTGWRTDNLQSAMESANLSADYNLVSLLIGVNDQFQGGSVEGYRPKFEELLQEAIRLAKGKKENVIVLSIPDYAYTPFGQSYSDPSVVSSALDQFNAANKEITESYGVRYYDITPISRRGLEEPELVASDGLHPSGKMYAEWVSLVLNDVETQTVTSLPEGRNQADWHIYPNPLQRGNFWKLQLPSFPKGWILKIFSATGQRIFQRVLDDETPLDLPLLPHAGLWKVCLFSEKGIQSSKTLVVY